MNKYKLMNKILEEEGTCEVYLKLEEEFAESEGDKFIQKLEDEGRFD